MFDTLHKIIAVFIVSEYLSAFYPPDNNPAERGIKHPGHPVGLILAWIVQNH